MTSGEAGTPDAIAGIDLGTSSLKGVVCSRKGTVLAAAQRAYPTDRPMPGRAEQDPADWLSALAAVLADLAGEVPASSWRGIGLSGMIPTLVTADADGAPTGPALTWEDARAEFEGAELREAYGPTELYAETGQWVDGRYLLPMWRWIERNDPGRAAGTAALLGAKDFLFASLTGERATDPSTATGFGCYDLRAEAWIDGLARGAALPEVRPSSSTSSILDERAEELGVPRSTPITLGAADSVSSAHALGVGGRNACAYVWGTSTVILGIADEIVPDLEHRYLLTPLAESDSFGREMDLLSTGAAISWTAELLNLSGSAQLPELDEPTEASRAAQILRLAERSQPGANGVAFLPYLAFGEQGALWEPDLRGAVVGLTLAHTPWDVARALVEAIVVESRRCVEVLDASGATVGEIRVTGAIARHDFFLQQLADATGKDVEAVGLSSAAAVGAAMLAAGSAAIPPSREEHVSPDPEAAAFWSERAARHDRLRETLRSAPR